MRFNLSPPNSVNWVRKFRGDLLDRTLIWSQAHFRQALREYERHYNERGT